MWPFIPGERFPYANFHSMNQDWIIKIVKEFYEKYNTIDEAITTGKQEITNKYNEVLGLLNQWYNTHSQDIATQLTNALTELDNMTDGAITAFEVAARQKAQAALESIPADYTTLGTNVSKLNDVVANRNDVSLLNSGKTTICIPLGPEARNTIITKNTGIPRTGGNNNFATANFIPVQKGTIYIISKLISFYVTGYNENFEHVQDYSQEDNVHAAGIIEIDNEDASIAYVKIGFYSSSGYLDTNYNSAEVIQYTNAKQKSKNFIDSQKLGPYTVTTTNNVSAISYSSVRIGMPRFEKAEKNIQIIRDANSNHDWRYLLVICRGINSDGYGTDFVNSDWNISTSEQYGTIIPKGCYYWLGYSLGTNNAVNVQRAIEEAYNYIHVYELDDNEPGICQFGTNIDTDTNSMTRAGVPDKQYANTDLYLVAINNSNFSVKLYNSNLWYERAWTAAYSVTSFYIPQGTWYRYNTGNNSVIRDITETMNNVIISTNWNNKTDMIKFMNGLNNELSNLRYRISKMENNSIPNYYIQHIVNKVNTINTLAGQLTSGDQFIFITDTHINGYGNNEMKSKALINYIVDNTAVQKLFNGGDINNAATGMPKAEYMQIVQDAMIYTQPDPINAMQYFITGNHDTGVDYIDGVEYGPIITINELVELTGNNAKKTQISTDPKSDTCFYFENNGIRYIVSNFGIDTYTGETIGDTFLFITKAILTSKLPVVILQHVLWNTASEDPTFRPYRLQVLESIVDACNNRSTVQYGDSADYRVNFSNCECTVYAIIGGHLHTDRFSYTQTGVPIIAVTCDNWKAQYNVQDTPRSNAAGTVNEQAFSVFTLDIAQHKLYQTRIGYGSDTEYTTP